MSDSKANDNIQRKSSAPERPPNAPDLQKARNADGKQIAQVELKRTNASDGSLRDRSQAQEQDESIQIVGLGAVASRQTKLTEKELLDPQSQSIFLTDLIRRQESGDKAALALVGEYEKAMRMKQGPARDAELDRLQKIVDRTYGQNRDKADPDVTQLDEDGRPIHADRPEQTGPKNFSLAIAYNQTESPSQKLADFVTAAATRAMDAQARSAYIQGQLDKVIGVAEGLNIAKEQVKDSARVAWTALTDGTVAQFLAKANAINDPLFKTVGNALDAMARDPNATNHILEKLGVTLLAANEQYNGLPNREKGRVIGETMFAMVNPEGSSKAGEAAMKMGDQLATHVDETVIDAIQNDLGGKQLESEIELGSKAGAGGDWPVINERPSPDVVRQTESMSCVSACGEMLSEGAIDQATLLKKLGNPAPTQFLARHLGSDWIAKVKDAEALDELLQGDSWAAEFREPMSIRYARLEPGHTVVVDGLDGAGNIMIRDPAHGTRYEMTRKEFLEVWTFISVYKK